METMAFGMLSVVVFVAAVCCLCCKKTLWGLIASIASIALTCWTGYCWKLMLISSGKDASLFGFHRYPAALIILCILLFLAIFSTVFSVISMARKR